MDATMSHRRGILSMVGVTWSSPLDALSERPSLDWLVAGVVVGIHAVVVTHANRFDPLASLSSDDRVDLYGTAINPVAILVGFTLAALAFSYSSDGRRTALVRSRGHRALRRTWLGTISGPLLVVAILLCAQVAERQGETAARWAAEVAFVAVAARAARFVWLLAQLLDLRQRPQSGARPPPERAVRPGQLDGPPLVRRRIVGVLVSGSDPERSHRPV